MTKDNFFNMLRRVIYLTLGKLDRALKRETKVFILCYHSISPNKSKWRFSNSKADFDKQMGYLAKSGYKFVSLEEVEKHIKEQKKLSTKSVCITFDDGYKDVLNAVPVVKKYGIKPAIFILSQPEIVDRNQVSNNLPLLTIPDMKRLIKSGWEVGCHSKTHADFAALSTSQEIVKQVNQARKDLQRKLGSKVHYFAYPKGVYSKAILMEVKRAGYKLGVSMDDQVIDQDTNLLTVPRIGVDASHSFEEFKFLFSPANIMFRKLIKS